MTTIFAQWRQTINEKYGVSYKNNIINHNMNELKNMKYEIDNKITNIRQERQNNLNILKKGMDIKIYQLQTELKEMKTEVEEKMKELNVDKNQNQKKQYLRHNKRKYGEIG
jgi:hypothetical protein